MDLMNEIKGKTSNSLFAKFFPPPRYLMMEAVGLDISDNIIRYLSFKNKGLDRKVEIFGEVSLPEGAISGGHINKPGVVSSVLRGVADNLKNKFVRVSLPEEKAYIYQVEVPKVVGVSPLESISYTLEENVPIKPDEAIFDYLPIPFLSSDQSNRINAVVGVIPRKVSEVYELVVREAGLLPLCFEIGSQSVARAITDPEDKKVRLIVNFNETKTSFSIVSRGLVRFTSTVQVGSVNIDRALSEIIKVSIDQIKEFKKRAVNEGEQNMEMFFQLMERIKPVHEEVKKLISYWKTHGASRCDLPKEISEIVLVGRDTLIPAFSEYFESIISIKTSPANIWRNAFSLDKNIPDLDFYSSLDYAGAVGLALRDLNH